MKKKKQQFGGLMVIAVIVLAVFILVKHFEIKGFRIVREGVLYTSAQPRGMDYTRMLYKYHIATIVNVRSAFEHREQNWYNEEITWTRNNGVKYVEVPIGKEDYFLDKQTQDEFLKVMSDRANLPVLLHGSGNTKRAAMLAAVWMRRGEGLGTEDTIKEAERIIGEGKISEKERKFVIDLGK